ncbi:MAG TPA: complex I subunit 5 family protein [Spirochaetia bacterium]|nr:complex I subunit 5 family protein [Spirochaetia bacterium]
MRELLGLDFLWPSWIWVVALPIVTSPLVYLLGRIFQRVRDTSELRRARGPWTANPIRWVSLGVMLLTLVPYAAAWRDLADGKALQLTVGLVALKFDGISLLLSGAVLVLGVLVSVFSGPYIGHETGQEKYHALLNAMIGAMLGLGCAADLFNLWIWFETAAVASYMLVAYHSDQPASLEAGMKYLVQNSVGSMLALIGIGLVFSQTGTLNLEALRSAIAAGAGSRPLFLAAGALFCVGFGVKIAMVPLHTWLPDAHAQAPSGISAMLSGVVIESGIVALLRALSIVASTTSAWGAIFLAFGAVNMIVGNLLALRQTQVKRLLAFSSLSHVGYMLLGLGFALSFGQAEGAQGGAFHLLTHAAMKGLAFLAAGSLLFALRLSRGDHGPLEKEDLSGAARRYPLIALSLTVALLGLGGLPPLGGFMSKWQIFASGARSGNGVAVALVVFGVLNSLLSFAYYAPLVSTMYRHTTSPLVTAGSRVPVGMVVPIVVLAALVVAFGVWPGLASGLTVPAGQVVLAIFSRQGGL